MKRTHFMLVSVAVLSGVLAATAIALAASSPTVTTGSHSKVTDTSADLHGTVNPNGTDTNYYFQWGLTTAYGVNSTEHSAGAGSKAVSVGTTATDLIPGTAYHYRLVATSGSGVTAGADRTFTTTGNPPPIVSTGPATGVGKNSATLTAVVGPNKQATTWFFQYGTSTAYGSQTIAQVVPAGTTPVTVTVPISGLEAQTIFHYRILAEHTNTVPQGGADGTFMTLPRQRPEPKIKARTTPGKDAHKPFTFTSSGSIHGPSWIPSTYDCVGNVTVRFLLGTRRVGSTLIPLAPNCKFSGQTVFNRIPGHHGGPVTLTVLVRFAGNGYLTPRRASAETVTLG
jgi:hypothetical protein